MDQRELQHQKPSVIRLPLDGGPEPYVYREARQILGLIDLCRKRWRAIVLPTLVATIVMALIAEFALTKTYQASAMVWPSSQSPFETHTPDLQSGISLASGAAAALGLGSPNNGPANEYMQVLQSPQFAIEVIQKHRVLFDFVEPDASWLSRRFPDLFPSLVVNYQALKSSRRLRWAVYRAFQQRFFCFYDADSEILTLSYVDVSPARAEEILSYILNDLQDTLRQWQMRNSQAAAHSLERQAASTPDVVLRTQLYLLAADQIQRGELARVDSDFAFAVLQAPASPLRKYRPRVVLDSLIAGIFTFGLLLGYFWLSSILRVISSARQEGERPERPVADDASPMLGEEELRNGSPRAG